MEIRRADDAADVRNRGLGKGIGELVQSPVPTGHTAGGPAQAAFQQGL
jgi:hypothetical protein